MKRTLDVTAVWTKVRTCSRVSVTCTNCGRGQAFAHYMHAGRTHCAKCFLAAVGAAEVSPIDLGGISYHEGKLVLELHTPGKQDDWPVGEARITQLGLLYRPFKGFPPGFDPNLRTEGRNWKPGDPCPRCGSTALGAEGCGTHRCDPGALDLPAAPR